MRLTKKSKIYVTVSHVARSGMSRWIKVFVLRNGKMINIGDLVAKKLGLRYDVGKGIYVQGCGMDVCFWLTYQLGSKLFNNGYTFKYYWL